MNQNNRVNRGLRYLCLNLYKDSQPELVTANIIKLQLLHLFDLNVVHLPLQPGCPHDGAVRIPQTPTQPEQLVWFDFMALLPDTPGLATRYGTLTLQDSTAMSPPAFYVVIFPHAAEYVAIIPHHVAVQQSEGVWSHISGITGVYLPYLLPVSLVPIALERIAIAAVETGVAYINPGTDVVLKRWLPLGTLEIATSLPSAPFGLESSATNTAQKRRRESDAEEGHIANIAPALRAITTAASCSHATMPSSGIPDLEFDAHLIENNLFGLNWTSDPQSAVSIAAQDIVPASQEYTRPFSSFYDDAGLSDEHALGYPRGGDASHVWMAEFLPDSDAGRVVTHTATFTSEAQRQETIKTTSKNLKTLIPAAPFSSNKAANKIRTNAFDYPPHISQTPPHQPNNLDLELDLEAEDQFPMLIHLPHHPIYTHIYLPLCSFPATINNTIDSNGILTALTTPSNLCLAISIHRTHTSAGGSTPLSQLSCCDDGGRQQGEEQKSCLYVLVSCGNGGVGNGQGGGGDVFPIYLLPSRWLSFYLSRLEGLRAAVSSKDGGDHTSSHSSSMTNNNHIIINDSNNNTTINHHANPTTQKRTKKNGLRGRNKLLTEHPTVKDVLNDYGIIGLTNEKQLLRGLEIESAREVRMRETDAAGWRGYGRQRGAHGEEGVDWVCAAGRDGNGKDKGRWKGKGKEKKCQEEKNMARVGKARGRVGAVLQGMVLM